MVHVPAGQTLVMQVSDDEPLQPRAVDRLADGIRVAVTRAVEQPLDLDRHAYWIEVRATGAEAASALLAFGGVPRRALGRLVTTGPAVSLVPVDYRGLLRTPDRVSEVLLMARDEQSQLIGTGWSRVAADAGGGYRWMAAAEARAAAGRRRRGAADPHPGPARGRRPDLDPVDGQRRGPAMAGAGARLACVRMGSARRPERPGPVETAVVVDALPAAADNQPPKAVAIADIRLIAR